MLTSTDVSATAMRLAVTQQVSLTDASAPRKASLTAFMWVCSLFDSWKSLEKLGGGGSGRGLGSEYKFFEVNSVSKNKSMWTENVSYFKKKNSQDKKSQE